MFKKVESLKLFTLNYLPFTVFTIPYTVFTMQASYRCQHKTNPRTETAKTWAASKNTDCRATIKVRLQRSTFAHKGVREASNDYKRKSQSV